MSKTEIETMIAKVEAATGSIRDRVRRLTGVAEVIAAKGYKVEAYQLCRKALAIDEGNSEALVRVRRVNARLTPSYHISMMNDTRRNLAWDKALANAVRPGMRAFEIGTGAGLLTLAAARAGAHIYTCEDDPVIAAVAREIVARNDLTSRVTILEKRSQQVDPDVDLGGPADLLFCDIFSNSLLGFNPLPALVDARRRLVTTQARSVPQAGIIRVALANWQEYARFCQIEFSIGFDVTAMAAFVPEAIPLPIDEPGLAVLSEGGDAFRFDFAARDQPATDEAIIELSASEDGEINGIVQWIRLELDDETAIEPRPEAGGISFENLLFYPLPHERSVQRGDVVSVHTSHDGRRLTIWV